jgi:hypothetical protein
MLEFLVQRTVLDLICSSSLLVCMTSLIYVSIVMTCLLYIRIKSYCILFINPTFFFFTLIDEFHMHSVSELALKACLWIRGVVSDFYWTEASKTSKCPWFQQRTRYPWPLPLAVERTPEATNNMLPAAWDHHRVNLTLHMFAYTCTYIFELFLSSWISLHAILYFWLVKQLTCLALYLGFLGLPCKTHLEWLCSVPRFCKPVGFHKTRFYPSF